MIRLRQLTGAHAGRVASFDVNVVRIGRLPDSEFALDAVADLDVSARHAVIEHDGARWTLIDVGSRNGTWVNGTRVARWVLRHGDEIKLGSHGPRIRVEIEGSPDLEDPQLPYDDTLIARQVRESLSDGKKFSRSGVPMTLPPPSGEVLVDESTSDPPPAALARPRPKATTGKTPRIDRSKAPVRTRAPITTFGLVVVSLAIGFAIGFAFAFAFFLRH